MAPKIIVSQYPNTRCKACNKHLPPGVNVRWTRGYGATCVSCPHPGHTDTAPVVIADSLAEHITSLVADLAAERVTVAHLRERLDVLANELLIERTAHTHTRNVLDTVQRERGDLATELRRIERELGVVGVTPSEPCDDPSEHEPWLGDPAAPTALDEDCPI